MPYYGGRGDYYRGDYYGRGDFLGTLKQIGGAVGRAAGIIGTVAGGGAAAAGAAVGKLAFGGKPKLPALPQFPGLGPLDRGKGAKGKRPKKGEPGYRGRRMNPLNVKALRRADRRAHSFLRATRSVVRHYVAKQPKGRSYVHFRKKAK